MTAGPSPQYLDLVGSRQRQLRDTMRRGQQPDPAALVGWEYRGVNLPAATRYLGLRRFIKGFRATDGAVEGYNKSVRGADVTTDWAPRPQKDGRVEFAPFSVAPVDPESVDNRYLNALLLDYGNVAQPEAGIAGRLRDYLFRVVPDSDDLLLGRAYLAIGDRRIAIGTFVLERMQEAP